MNKILLLTVALIYHSSFAQCFIKGNSTITVGVPETFTVEKSIENCKNCHVWTIDGGNVSIEGSDKESSVKLKGNFFGGTILSLVMTTEKETARCSKVIDVTDPILNEPQNNNANCDIDFSDYKEVKNDDGKVSFSPMKTENNFKFYWTVVFENGEQKTSEEKVPQFNYAKENGIVSVTGKIVSKKCIRNFTKKYDSNFWRFF